MNDLKQKAREVLENAGFEIEIKGDRLVFWRRETCRFIGVLNFSEYPVLVGFGVGVQSEYQSKPYLQTRLIVTKEHAAELFETVITEYNFLSTK
ncbi:hypothetical protein [Bdellovibrio sp. NC01]|uniref:hypothetical protein n=1 Tax=Bdellovibrio sp. NC01 TaxID=2220073 RepID=UPI001158C635|nr:hypothetical protein [Bdellovibrio sp. NC01]QDK36715.1 hypothetical protein DOE51_03405 [Bdellovibrio sp. NC01]